MKKKFRLKEPVKNVIAAVSLYLILIIGVIAINFRLSDLEQQKSANEGSAQIAQLNSN